MKYIVREAEEKDAKAVHDIYGYYVKGVDVTFTVENPSVEAYKEKIVRTKKKYPFLVAEDEMGNIVGYCNGSQLRPHDAYRWNVESTIMLSPDAPKRQGIASLLYQRFFEELKERNYQYVYAVIVDTNDASIALHNALGFQEVGHFAKAGYKDEQWLGITWMQKYVGDETKEVEEPVWYA